MRLPLLALLLSPATTAPDFLFRHRKPSLTAGHSLPDSDGDEAAGHSLPDSDGKEAALQVRAPKNQNNDLERREPITLAIIALIVGISSLVIGGASIGVSAASAQQAAWLTKTHVKNMGDVLFTTLDSAARKLYDLNEELESQSREGQRAKDGSALRYVTLNKLTTRLDKFFKVGRLHDDPEEGEGDDALAEQFGVKGISPFVYFVGNREDEVFGESVGLWRTNYFTFCPHKDLQKKGICKRVPVALPDVSYVQRLLLEPPGYPEVDKPHSLQKAQTSFWWKMTKIRDVFWQMPHRLQVALVKAKKEDEARQAARHNHIWYCADVRGTYTVEAGSKRHGGSLKNVPANSLACKHLAEFERGLVNLALSIYRASFTAKFLATCQAAVLRTVQYRKDVPDRTERQTEMRYGDKEPFYPALREIPNTGVAKELTDLTAKALMGALEMLQIDVNKKMSQAETALAKWSKCLAPPNQGQADLCAGKRG